MPRRSNTPPTSPELEDRVRTYFGLEPLLPPTPEETYPPEDTARFGPDARVDTEPGERVEDQERIAGQPAPVAGEPVDATPEDRWDRETGEGGVVFHRRRA
jgi:hypothetical protein